MTRVAFITPYLPWPADTGGKLRSYYLLRGLARRAEVDLYTVYDTPTPPDGAGLQGVVRRTDAFQLRRGSHPGRLRGLVDHLPRSVRYFQTPGSINHVASRLAEGYDLHISDEIVMADYCLSGTVVFSQPRLVMRQKVDHIHYAEMAAARPFGSEKLLDWIEARRLRRYEQAVMPLFDGGVFCSVADRDTVRTYMRADARCAVLVNGADTEYFRPDRNPDARPTLLLLGTMHYYPNVDATLYFFREIYPQIRAAVPDLQVFIVGHLPPPEIQALAREPGVTVTGSVPDVRPYIARSWAMVVPLRLGGGTRLKIMEAMASALPCVSTSIGAEGTGVVHGEHVLLADSPQAFAEQSVFLLRDAALRGRLAANGLQYVRENFSWQALGSRFADFCLELIEQRKSRPGARAKG